MTGRWTENIIGKRQAKEDTPYGWNGKVRGRDPGIRSMGIRVTEDEHKAISGFASRRRMTITEAVLKGLHILMGEPEKQQSLSSFPCGQEGK